MLGWLTLSVLAAMLLMTFGCAETPLPPDGPRRVALEKLMFTPNEYDGEHVVVMGGLQRGKHLFFESIVTTNNIKHVIYIRPDYRDMNTPASGVPSTGCENETVRVYGRFRKGSQYESMLDGVYRIVRIHNRAPGPLDFICWSNPSADPSHGLHTIN